jgi:hypothetical protein
LTFSRSSLAAVCFLVHLLPLNLDASLLVIPPGLNPGDQYRIAFMTAGTLNATSTDISDYNAFVNNAANGVGSLLSPLNATWKVIGATAASGSALDNIGGASLLPIYLLDGTLVANDTTDLFDSFLISGISLDEHGDDYNVTGNFWAWSGTDDLGLAAPGNELGSGAVFFGYAGAPAAWLAYSTADPNNFVSSLYGISTPLTVTPEPATFAMILGGAALIFANQRRRT